MPDEPRENPARPRRRPPRAVVLLALAALGLLAMAGGGTGLALELTREPTRAEVEAAGTAELAARWRARSAGEIFPLTIGYAAPTTGDDLVEHKARRIGIAPAAPCAEALDAKAAEILNRNGCRTVLRATYSDVTGTLLTTLGVAVLPDTERAGAVEAGFSALGTLAKDDHGLRAVAFADTAAAGFTDARRQVRWTTTDQSPYVFLRVSGWADARGESDPGDRAERFEYAEKILAAVMADFVKVDRPCETRGVRC